MGKYKRIKGPVAGVTCYEHPERKHGRRPDRYFLLRYRDGLGKQHEESLGWASEGWTDDKAIARIVEIRENIRIGEGPQSLQQKREIIIDTLDSDKRLNDKAERDALTFSAAASIYLDWARTNKKSWNADETRLRLHLLPCIGDIPLVGINSTHLEKIKSSMAERYAPATIRQCLVLAVRVFSHSRQHHGIDGVPVFLGDIPAIKPPKVHNERERFLTEDEAEHLIAVAAARRQDVADMIELALHTGMRRNEIQDLVWRNVNMISKVISITGTDGLREKGKGRIYLNSKAIAVINRRKQLMLKSTHVFPGENGRRVDVSKVFFKVARDAGLNIGVTDRRHLITFHSLRHTFASWLAMAGTPILTIKKLMRHRSIEMTMRYAHLIPDVERQAVERLCSRLA